MKETLGNLYKEGMYFAWDRVVNRGGLNMDCSLQLLKRPYKYSSRSLNGLQNLIPFLKPRALKQGAPDLGVMVGRKAPRQQVPREGLTAGHDVGRWLLRPAVLRLSPSLSACSFAPPARLSPLIPPGRALAP